MAWTMSSSGSAIATAGANVNSTIAASGAQLERWSNEAESFICNEIRKDAITGFATWTAAGKQILASIHDAFVAQKIISYEPESIGTQSSTLRLNVLENSITRGINQIKEDNVKKYLGAT